MSQTIHEQWNSMNSRMGLKPWKRGRGECPFCDSRTGFSCHDDKGFYCFACGRKGDKISFVQQYHDCDFKSALRFFGLEPGRPPKADPAIEHRRKVRQGLHTWAQTTQKKLRDEYYLRTRYEVHGKRRLQADPEDEIGWQMLSLAYKGIPFEELDYWLDLLIGNEAQQLTAYKSMRKISA